MYLCEEEEEEKKEKVLRAKLKSVRVMRRVLFNGCWNEERRPDGYFMYYYILDDGKANH